MLAARGYVAEIVSTTAPRVTLLIPVVPATVVSIAKKDAYHVPLTVVGVT